VADMHAHSLDVKVSGGRRNWRRDSSRAGGVGAVAIVIALLLDDFGRLQSALEMTPARLVFAAQPAGSASDALAVTLINRGTTVVEVARLTLSNPTSFGVTRTDCPAGQIPPGARCLIYVDFHPAAVGDFSGTLQQNETGPRVELVGTGATGRLADAAPRPPVDQPDAPRDPPPATTPPTTTPPKPGPVATPPKAPPTSAPQTPKVEPLVRASFDLDTYDAKALVGDTTVVDVVLRNTGETTIGPVQLRFERTLPAFALPLGGCVLSEPQTTCAIEVNFTPPQEGSHLTSLVAETSKGPLARTELTGIATAKAPDAVLSRSRIEFDKTDDQVSLVVQNRGSAPLRIDGVAIDNTKDFDVRADACTKPGLVEPQKSCAMFVRFKGRARASGQLTVRHNDPPLSSSVELAALTAPQLLNVPRLTGSKRDEALRDIVRARFTVGNVEETPRCESLGEVVNQKPERGTKALESSPIDIWIASVGPNPAIVPDVRQQPQAIAERQILAARLLVRMGPREETDSVPSGAIARVEPRPQTRLAPNCPVTLRVAVPVPRIQVPNYVKRTLADVKQTLKGGAAGLFEPFRLGTVRTSDNTPVPSGNDQFWIVIAQNPAAGTMVPRPSGLAVATTIELTVMRLNRID